MNTYAVVEAGGEQIRLESGRFYDVSYIPYSEKLSSKNTKMILSSVLMIHYESKVLLGYPWIENAIVKGRILSVRRNEKIIAYKMKPKKKTRRKTGHRQNLTRFIVDGIFLDGKKI